MRLKSLLLGAALILTTGSVAHASLSAMNLDRLPQGNDAARLAEDLKVLEQVAGNWSPEWRHEMPKQDAVSLAERTLRKIDDLIARDQASAGELLILKGLTAHYAYNLDQQIYFDIAADSLRKAQKALPADCRPLWFLGNHYTKGADAETGMPLLKQAVDKCGGDLPLAFWEDYAYAAVIAAMPATAQYGLDQVKARNAGLLTEKVKATEGGVKRRLMSPAPGKEYELEDIWQFEKNDRDGTVRFVNGMYGFMIDVPGKWGVTPLPARNGRSGIGVTLPKKGKWPPPLEVVVLVTPASPGAAPEKVLRTFLTKAGRSSKTFNNIASPGVSAGDKYLWIESRQKKGSRVVAGILRRPQPAYPGLLLESPHNVPKSEDESQVPRYYAPVEQLTRLSGDLDYIVMVEGAPAAFDKGGADLELLLRHLVAE